MAETWFLTSLVAGIPALACVIVWANSTDMSERHHSHHDTYTIASTFSWVVVFCMVVMGALGVLLSWLCSLHVFSADPLIVEVFFAAFLGVAFVAWALMRRYKVVTFDDYMCVTPLMGPVVTIYYADISAMQWTNKRYIPRRRGISVYVGHRRRALLWAMLDLDQILMRIDRFDVLENLSA